MTRSRLPIQTRLVTWLTLVAIVMVGLNMLVILWHESSTLERQARLRSEALARDLAAQVRSPLLNYDHYMLERAAGEELEHDNVVYAIISDKEHRVVARSLRHGLDSEPVVAELGDGIVERSLTDGTPVLDVVQPVVVDETGDRWGTVRLGLDLRPVRQEISRLRGLLIVTAAGVLLLGVAGTLWLARRITSPIRTLHRRTLALVKADSETTVDTTDGDEVDALMRSFELMSQRLEAEREQRAQVMVNMEDLIQKRTAAQAESEKRWRDLFERVKDAVYIADADDRLVVVNPAAEELFGCPKEELLGRPVAAFYANPQDRDRLLEQMSRTGFVRDFETRMLSRPNDYRQVVETCQRVPTAGGSMHTTEGIIKDVTAKRRLEEQLAQVQQMETVGTLAGGVAHDFNNILAGIMASAQLMRLQQQSSERVAELAKLIERQAERGAGLTQQILNFARREAPQIRAMELNGLILETLVLVGQALKSDIVTQADLFAGELFIKADQSQLQQVVMNLALNARDAMSEGGTLTLRTRSVEVDDAFSRTRPTLRTGPYAVLEIADTGRGIPEETTHRIFEPFFTTKPRGKGTGLGLAMAYGIVTAHGGHIEVNSTPGQGSTFTVYLRLCGEAPSIHPEQSLAPTEGSGYILLVDDEETLRSVVKDALETFGYRVDTAVDGQDAVERFRSADYDLVLLDMMMPRMGGKQAFLKMREHKSDARVLLMSGYADSAGIGEALRCGALGLLKKPFRMQKLLGTLRELLEGASV